MRTTDHFAAAAPVPAAESDLLHALTFDHVPLSSLHSPTIARESRLRLRILRRTHIVHR